MRLHLPNNLKLARSRALGRILNVDDRMRELNGAGAAKRISGRVKKVAISWIAIAASVSDLFSSSKTLACWCSASSLTRSGRFSS
jgi:hypothetical protein